MPKTIANHNTHLIVKNLKGSSGHRRARESWIKYYRRVTGSARQTCCVLGCSSSFEVGAHVFITDRRCDNARYIAPFCQRCNNHRQTGKLTLKRNTVIIRATIK